MVSYDLQSFEDTVGNSNISKRLMEAIDFAVEKIEEHEAIRKMEFEHIDYGDKYLVSVVKDGSGYTVSLMHNENTDYLS